MTFPLIAIAVCLVGLVLFFVCSKPTSNQELKEVAKIMFFCGLLATLFLLGHEGSLTVHP